MCDNPEGISVSSEPLEGPFSALTPSMWPSLQSNAGGKNAEEGNDEEVSYDEFGFRIDAEDDGTEHEQQERGRNRL